MTDLLFAPQPVFTHVERTGPACVRRTETIRPGMCGPLQSFVATVGDWTWEAVSTLCGLDVFSARDGDGNPSYLAFYYYRITGGGDLSPADLTFGDRVTVDSRVFDAGRRSVLTVHRLSRENGPEPPPLELEELHGRPRPGCLYVENLNVWITRGAAGGNTGLIRSAPVGFAHEHLPKVPEQYAPRFLCARARDDGAFPHHGPPLGPVAPSMRIDHRVDPTRDVNGVGLLHFASFFSLAEGAQLLQWRSRGLEDRAFLGRRLLDARICYLGNADLDARLAVDVATGRSGNGSARETSDLVVRDLGAARTIAVASLTHRLA
ncbi:LnmK family bifunctional acyltransferase/decarboxylase [Kitasatospora cineracea]|uniref:LnmK family bifunctional acyltransferase/decarboxylase n=1 Tax=Kitasatospora cineracea TaxID=88074 RepID=UPI0036DC029B